MKNLSQSRRNEIAYLLILLNTAENGMGFEVNSNKIMERLGIKRSELVAFKAGVAGKLTKESFKKKWRNAR